jgi:hypothetical protein
MSRDGLAIHLNDHLAGSAGAVELVERTIGQNEGTAVARTLAEILSQIREEQQVLRDLIGALDSGESPLKKAGAWLAEKAARIKLGDTGSTALARMQALEALAIGIQGKLALWRALQRVADRYPELADIDLVKLERRAREQFERVEEHRIEAAVEAL